METVCCLCPTYGRPPHLIANTIQCFLDQDYSKESRNLLILDDLGNVTLDPELHENGVHLVSVKERYSSLPAKYNHLRWLGFADVQIVWEDDEIYLPHHISSCVRSLREYRWVHPSRVWSTYTGSPQKEEAAGRFHAALGFRREFLDAIGGWPVTDEPNFDQQLISLARQYAPPGRPDHSAKGPSYVFRWSDTGATHGQNTMDKGNDWYRDAKPQFTDPVHLTMKDIRYDDAAEKSISVITGR